MSFSIFLEMDAGGFWIGQFIQHKSFCVFFGFFFFLIEKNNLTLYYIITLIRYMIHDTPNENSKHVISAASHDANKRRLFCGSGRREAELMAPGNNRQ